MAILLYGSGLRINNIDFDRKRIKTLGKGDKWRSTILPPPIIPVLHDNMKQVKSLHHTDLEEDFGEV